MILTILPEKSLNSMGKLSNKVALPHLLWSKLTAFSVITLNMLVKSYEQRMHVSKTFLAKCQKSYENILTDKGVLLRVYLPYRLRGHLEF